MNVREYIKVDATRMRRHYDDCYIAAMFVPDGEKYVHVMSHKDAKGPQCWYCDPTRFRAWRAAPLPLARIYK